MKTKWHSLLNFIKKHPCLVLFTFISGLFYNISTLLIPISLGRFYEFNFGYSTHRLKMLKFIPYINTNHFQIFLVVFIILVFLRFLFEFSNKYLIGIIGEKYAQDLREELFEHQLNIKTKIYKEKGIGKYLLRYSGDFKSIQNYVTKGLFRFWQDVFLILFLLLAIAYIDFSLAAIVACSILISYVLLFYLNVRLYHLSVNRRNQRSGLLSFVNTRLRAIHSIKTFNKYSIELKRYKKRSKRLFLIGKDYQSTLSFIQALIPAFTYLMLALLMSYVYYKKMHAHDNFNQSAVLILILLIISFLPIFRRILRVSIIWKLGNISFEKLFNIFSMETENNLPLQKIKLKEKEIRFENVSYKFAPSSPYIFEKINFLLPPQKTSLIKGRSGTGKNTLINLILKIYTPIEGDIYYGEINQNELSEKTIRRNFAVISDSLPLYGKTVYEAIVYSRNDKNKEKVEELLMELQKFENPENRLEAESPIGELGALLTNGQKKILQFARALFTRKPWLILDKAFENLNPETQNLLKKKINKMNHKKGIIIFDSSEIEGLDIDNRYLIVNKKIINEKK